MSVCIIYIYIYHFIILFSRNCLVFFAHGLISLCFQNSAVYAVQRVYFIACQWHVAFCGASSQLLVGCRRPRQLAGRGGECAVWSALWRRTSPIPPRHVAYAASLWFRLSASWKRRPTINGQCSDCSDSRTCSQCSFFTFVSGHVSLTFPLRTLQLSWRSYVGLQRIRTFCCMGVRSVS